MRHSAWCRGLPALEVGVDLIAEIGAGRLYEGAQALSEFFLACLAAQGAGLECLSPTLPGERGSQPAFHHHEAAAICPALIARRVIGDVRDPDVLRFGFAPAYLRLADIAAAACHRAEVLASGE
jgi:kynureninase